MRLLLFCLVLAYGCKPIPEIEIGPKGEVVSQPSLWRTPINEGNIMGAGVSSSVIYNGQVLCPGALAYSPPIANFSRGAMNMMSIETGKIQWNWKNYIRTNDALDMYIHYKIDNHLIVSNGPTTYCIDLSTGKSVWSKIKRDALTTNSIVTGIGNSYFFCGDTYSKEQQQWVGAVYRGNVLAPDPEELIASPTLPKELTGETGIPAGATSLLAFAQEGDTMLVIDYQTASLPANQGIIRSVFGLYNVSKRKWVYDNVATTLPNYGTTVDGLPVVYNGKVYHSVGRYFTCHDLATGAKIWEKTFNGNFLFSGFVIANGIVVANCEDTYIYGLDPTTGSELWREKSSGTSTRLVYQDGVVYYAGGGDGLLHAVDVQTGKHLWKLQSPDFKSNSDAYFWGMVAGLPAQNGKKGRIFASTGLNVYCYEAVK
jgi:outer membrane protein assembly factor BamB